MNNSLGQNSANSDLLSGTNNPQNISSSNLSQSPSLVQNSVSNSVLNGNQTNLTIQTPVSSVLPTTSLVGSNKIIKNHQKSNINYPDLLLAVLFFILAVLFLAYGFKRNKNRLEQ